MIRSEKASSKLDSYEKGIEKNIRKAGIYSAEEKNKKIKMYKKAASEYFKK